MTRTQVAVVGAGMSGLAAARTLQEHGVSTLVLDKGRAVGGRMATRRHSGAVFDHGAQHFSARSDEFRERVADWIGAGLVHEWFRSGSITEPLRGIEPRHAVSGGMRRLPEHLAADLDVCCDVRVGRLRCDDARIRLLNEAGAVVGDCVAAVITAPLPQTLQLLSDSRVEMALQQTAQLSSIRYDATLVAMALPRRAPVLPEGHLTPDDGIVAWIADNQHKGASPSPSVTVHSTAEFAATHLEEDPAAWMGVLVEAAARYVGVALTAVRGHRWRYSQPQSTLSIGAMSLHPEHRIVLAGEAFVGARVEGAFLSGLAAAEQVLELL